MRLILFTLRSKRVTSLWMPQHMSQSKNMYILYINFITSDQWLFNPHPDIGVQNYAGEFKPLSKFIAVGSTCWWFQTLLVCAGNCKIMRHFSKNYIYQYVQGKEKSTLDIHYIEHKYFLMGHSCKKYHFCVMEFCMWEMLILSSWPLLCPLQGSYYVNKVQKIIQLYIFL